MANELNYNTLKRYEAILKIYNQYKTDDIPLTKVLKNYIFPVYPITRQTLYNILSTPVAKLLKQYEQCD